MLYQRPSQQVSRLLKWSWKISKNLKFVSLDPRVQSSTFWQPLILLTVSSMFKMLYKWSLQRFPKLSKWFWENSKDLEFVPLGLMVKLSTFWKSSKFTQFLNKALYKWSLQHFPRLSKWFWEISKDLKFVPLDLRVQISTS